MKKTYVRISNYLLSELLQLPENVQIDLVYTPDINHIYKPGYFEIILSGDGLDDKFEVFEDYKLMQSTINYTSKTIVIVDKVEIT